MSNLSRKKLFTIISIIAVVAFVIPLTIIQVRKQQEIRQRAAEPTQISFLFSPPQVNTNAGQDFSLDLNLQNSQGFDISAVDITIIWNKDNLDLTGFDLSTSGLTQQTKDIDHGTGELQFVGANIDDTKEIKDISLKLGTLQFKRKTPAETPITLIKADVGSANDVFPKLTASLASFTLLSPPAPTPIPKPILTSQCVIDDCGGPGACSFDATCAQVGSGKKNCACVANSSLTPTVSPPTPTPTPVPSALCNNSNSADNDCLKKFGKFCAVGLSCKQNPFSTITDCTCQSDATPTPTPSNLCAPADCKNLCAPGFACSQIPGAATKLCECLSTTTPTPTPTPTATPVPTPLPGSSLLALSLKVPGIGTASAENLPRTISRPVIVIVRTATKDIEKQGTLVFSKTDGLFKTDPKRPVDLGTSIPITPLDLVIKADFFKGFVSDVSLSQGLNTVTLTPPLKLGLDDSGNVDAVSFFNVLTGCFGAKSCTNKLGADLNDDGNVDGIDFNIFLRSLPTPAPTPTSTPIPTPKP